MIQRPNSAEPKPGLTKAGLPRQRRPRAQHPPAVTPDMLEGAPEFEPVPRIHARYDGWTPTGSAPSSRHWPRPAVSRAAKWVGMADAGAYALRRSKGAESFRRAWAEAQSIGIERLSDVAFERALYGVPVPVFHKGEQVGKRRWYNDRLLMFTLRHHDPERYTEASAGNRVPPHVKKALRREWEQERIERSREEAKNSRERLAAKLSEMNRQMGGDG
ncbi:MAG TPA: hypothetical protein VKQ09_03940 [Sphingomonas sp.]|nr:hypothetical protein [Sphingomonas sp.]